MSRKQATVKELISCLCHILDPDKTRSLCPETFRLAKFDDESSEATLRLVLAELLIFLKVDKYDSESCDFIKRFTDVEVEYFVCKELDDVGSSVCRKFSSRTNLLNVCWLICNKNILEKLTLNRSVTLGEDICSLGLKDGKFRKTDFGNTDSVDPIAQLSSMRWLYGSIMAKLKILKSMTSQTGKLLTKIHVATEGAGFSRDRNHLSMMEVYLIKHPNEMKVVVQKLENDNSLLENLVTFKENEHVFWKWMDSVLDAHLSNSMTCTDRHLDSKMLDTRLKRLEISHQKVHNEISNQEDKIEALDNWIENEEDVLDPCSKESTLTETENKISKNLEKYQQIGSFLKVHYPNLLSFTKTFASPPRDKNKNYVGRTSSEKVDPYEMYENVESLIEKIRRKTQELDDDINDLRCQYYDLI